jgi:hypothetical protein
VSVPRIREELDITYPTAQQHLERMQALGIVREFTGKKRNRLFVYDQFLNILNEGTEPLT